MRFPDIAVISDVHLGTRACRAAELASYLTSIEPRMLVLNGDIIDLLRMRGGYWPASHAAVIDRVLEFANSGVEVYYLCGNHDLAIGLHDGRDFAGVRFAQRLDMELAGRRTLFMHGHVVDEHTESLPYMLGSLTFDAVQSISLGVDRLAESVGWQAPSLLSVIKRRFGPGAAYVLGFERRCAEYARLQGFASVVCGHIHLPRLHQAMAADSSMMYVNSGDWVEHCTAVEFSDDRWDVVRTRETVSAAAAASAANVELDALAAVG